jgi:hypothetical protein
VRKHNPVIFGGIARKASWELLAEIKCPFSPIWPGSWTAARL